MEEIKYKFCTQCERERLISDFSNNKQTSDGLERYRRGCMSINRKLRREKNYEQSIKTEKVYREKNIERIREYTAKRTKEDPKKVSERSAKYYAANKEKCQISAARWREKNREKRSQKAKEYREQNLERCLANELKSRTKNKERIKQRLKEYRNLKRKTDPSYKLKSYLSTRLWYALKNQNTVKSKNTTTLVGCSIEELKQYIESLFTEGMTWKNYGEWHVDHIKPCVMFDLSDLKQQEECFHYSNLQPLWEIDNIEKGSFYEGRKYLRKDLSV